MNIAQALNKFYYQSWRTRLSPWWDSPIYFSLALSSGFTGVSVLSILSTDYTKHFI
jgi:hypothetical protein